MVPLEYYIVMWDVNVLKKCIIQIRDLFLMQSLFPTTSVYARCYFWHQNRWTECQKLKTKLIYCKEILALGRVGKVS